MGAHQLLLVGAVTAVGIFHTLVQDHWLPIVILARRRNWGRRQIASAAFVAGLGHTVSTLVIGVIVWFAGVAVAVRLGNAISLLSGLALVLFGLWMAVAAMLELRHHRAHRQPNPRTALLLILGSSPMVEGIPAFFAAGRFGVALLAIMAGCFALSTTATYVVLCVSSHAALERLSLGPLEPYGEVVSGSVIAIVGLVFLFWLPV